MWTTRGLKDAERFLKMLSRHILSYLWFLHVCGFTAFTADLVFFCDGIQPMLPSDLPVIQNTHLHTLQILVNTVWQQVVFWVGISVLSWVLNHPGHLVLLSRTDFSSVVWWAHTKTALACYMWAYMTWKVACVNSKSHYGLFYKYSYSKFTVNGYKHWDFHLFTANTFQDITLG